MPHLVKAVCTIISLFSKKLLRKNILGILNRSLNSCLNSHNKIFLF
nr:MAG TPA: hypothetical protein [Bacteriophage sp.]